MNASSQFSVTTTVWYMPTHSARTACDSNTNRNGNMSGEVTEEVKIAEFKQASTGVVVESVRGPRDVLRAGVVHQKLAVRIVAARPNLWFETHRTRPADVATGRVGKAVRQAGWSLTWPSRVRKTVWKPPECTLCNVSTRESSNDAKQDQVW